MPSNKPLVCERLTFSEACQAFVQPQNGTQSASHIRRMHWYVACRLVIEGGFHPETIKPRPPFRVDRKGKAMHLVYDTSVARGAEATVYGGLKTKDIDVVVSLDGIGPCVAISMKGTLNAFRNLTNRMEEAVGDCTNLHIAYPALVYAFLHLIRANREGPLPTSAHKVMEPDPRTSLTKKADVALRMSGEVSGFISTYHDSMVRLAGRRDLRDDATRYEAVALLLLEARDDAIGEVVNSYPPAESELHFRNFFPTIYQQYDLRFVYGAPNLRSVTRRHMWHPDSPALSYDIFTDMSPRISESDEVRVDELDELPPQDAERGET